MHTETWLTAEDYLENMVRTYSYYQQTPVHIMREAGDRGMEEALVTIPDEGGQRWSYDPWARRVMARHMAEAGRAYRERAIDR